jgi:hypothetical protein
MERPAREGTNLRLEQREHEEPVRGQLEHLGPGILGGRLDHHPGLDQPLYLGGPRPVAAVVHANERFVVDQLREARAGHWPDQALLSL